jgi:3-oxoacyl-[acyl-carrier protein] reductase
MLAEEGWVVGVNYANDADGAAEVVAQIEEAGGVALHARGDVTRADDVEEVFTALEERFGRVSVLVNNAGVRADRLVPQLADEDWTRVIDTNLSGPFWTSRRALMAMVRARFGRIVNVASVVGANIGNPGQSNYCAAKAGLVGLTRSVAREVAHRGVTVNAVAPGLVHTRLTADLDGDWAKEVPARRAGTPEEVAACVRFLASDAAAYVTGTTLTVDGGMTA